MTELRDIILDLTSLGKGLTPRQLQVWERELANADLKRLRRVVDSFIRDPERTGLPTIGQVLARLPLCDRIRDDGDSGEGKRSSYCLLDFTWSGEHPSRYSERAKAYIREHTSHCVGGPSSFLEQNRLKLRAAVGCDSSQGVLAETPRAEGNPLDGGL